MSEEDAVRDFLLRIQHYVSVYETIEDEEELSYIKVCPPEVWRAAKAIAHNTTTTATTMMPVDQCQQQDGGLQDPRLPAWPNRVLCFQSPHYASPHLAHQAWRKHVQRPGQLRMVLAGPRSLHSLTLCESWLQGRIGGDAGLSAQGQRYAETLKEFISTHYPAGTELSVQFVHT